MKTLPITWSEMTSKARLDKCERRLAVLRERLGKKTDKLSQDDIRRENSERNMRHGKY